MRTALLSLGIVLCLGFAAMTVSVVAGLEIERWTLSVILLGAFLIAAVGVVAMILLALISALRHPPED